MSKKRTS